MRKSPIRGSDFVQDLQSLRKKENYKLRLIRSSSAECIMKSSLMMAGNEWIHSTRKAIIGEEIGLDFEPEDIHIMRLNETEEEFDARIEEYVEMEEQEAGLINAIEEERDEENNL